MRIFVDTSGILAVLDASDRWHPAIRQTWDHLLTTGAELATARQYTSLAFSRRLEAAGSHLEGFGTLPG